MNYTLIVGMTSERNAKPTLRDINIAIDALDADNSNPFIVLVLESSEDINNSTYMQVLKYNNYNEMQTGYRIEIHIGAQNSFKHYKYTTEKK